MGRRTAQETRAVAGQSLRSGSQHPHRKPLSVHAYNPSYHPEDVQIARSLKLAGFQPSWTDSSPCFRERSCLKGQSWEMTEVSCLAWAHTHTHTHVQTHICAHTHTYSSDSGWIKMAPTDPGSQLVALTGRDQEA